MTLVFFGENLVFFKKNGVKKTAFTTLAPSIAWANLTHPTLWPMAQTMTPGITELFTFHIFYIHSKLHINIYIY